jgi:hypothetical protein
LAELFGEIQGNTFSNIGDPVAELLSRDGMLTATTMPSVVCTGNPLSKKVPPRRFLPDPRLESTTPIRVVRRQQPATSKAVAQEDQVRASESPKTANQKKKRKGVVDSSQAKKKQAVCRRENTKADSSSKRPQKGNSKKK